jgi:hypothetical protein
MERITLKAMGLCVSMLVAASTIMAQPNDGTMPDTTSNGTGGSSGTGWALEVGLLDLHAQSEGGGVVLEWTTATENDVMHYVVERSSDGQHFEAVGLVYSPGYSTDVALHSFTDADAMTGTQYYRVRTVRQYLPVTVSFVVIVEHLNKVEALSLYPCPAASELHVQLPRDHGPLQYRILDGQGRCHREGQLDGPAQRLMVEGLPAGAFTLYVIDVRGSVLYATLWLKL